MEKSLVVYEDDFPFTKVHTTWYCGVSKLKKQAGQIFEIRNLCQRGLNTSHHWLYKSPGNSGFICFELQSKEATWSWSQARLVAWLNKLNLVTELTQFCSNDVAWYTQYISQRTSPNWAHQLWISYKQPWLNSLSPYGASMTSSRVVQFWRTWHIFSKPRQCSFGDDAKLNIFSSKYRNPKMEVTMVVASVVFCVLQFVIVTLQIP